MIESNVQPAQQNGSSDVIPENELPYQSTQDINSNIDAERLLEERKAQLNYFEEFDSDESDEDYIEETKSDHRKEPRRHVELDEVTDDSLTPQKFIFHRKHPTPPDLPDEEEDFFETKDDNPSDYDLHIDSELLDVLDASHAKDSLTEPSISNNPDLK